MHRPLERVSCPRRGVSLPELLVVIALLALAMMVSIPLVASRVHSAKVRAAASQYAATLRAARMVAVSRQTPVEVALYCEGCSGSPGYGPDGRYSYSYLDSDGRVHTIEMPAGTWIDREASILEDLAVRFAPDGSLAAPARTVIKTLSTDGAEAWIVDVPVTGVPRLSHEILGDDGG